MFRPWASPPGEAPTRAPEKPTTPRAVLAPVHNVNSPPHAPVGKPSSKGGTDAPSEAAQTTAMVLVEADAIVRAIEAALRRVATGAMELRALGRLLASTAPDLESVRDAPSRLIAACQLLPKRIAIERPAAGEVIIRLREAALTKTAELREKLPTAAESIKSIASTSKESLKSIAGTSTKENLMSIAGAIRKTIGGGGDAAAEAAQAAAELVADQARSEAPREVGTGTPDWLHAAKAQADARKGAMPLGARPSRLTTPGSGGSDQTASTPGSTPEWLNQAEKILVQGTPRFGLVAPVPIGSITRRLATCHTDESATSPKPPQSITRRLSRHVSPVPGSEPKAEYYGFDHGTAGGVGRIRFCPGDAPPRRRRRAPAALAIAALLGILGAFLGDFGPAEVTAAVAPALGATRAVFADAHHALRAIDWPSLPPLFTGTWEARGHGGHVGWHIDTWVDWSAPSIKPQRVTSPLLVRHVSPIVRLARRDVGASGEESKAQIAPAALSPSEVFGADRSEKSAEMAPWVIDALERQRAWIESPAEVPTSLDLDLDLDGRDLSARDEPIAELPAEPSAEMAAEAVAIAVAEMVAETAAREVAEEMVAEAMAKEVAAMMVMEVAAKKLAEERAWQSRLELDEQAREMRVNSMDAALAATEEAEVEADPADVDSSRPAIALGSTLLGGLGALVAALAGAALLARLGDNNAEFVEGTDATDDHSGENTAEMAETADIVAEVVSTSAAGAAAAEAAASKRKPTQRKSTRRRKTADTAEINEMNAEAAPSQRAAKSRRGSTRRGARAASPAPDLGGDLGTERRLLFSPDLDGKARSPPDLGADLGHVPRAIDTSSRAGQCVAGTCHTSPPLAAHHLARERRVPLDRARARVRGTRHHAPRVNHEKNDEEL